MFSDHCGPILAIENKIAYGLELRAEFSPGFRVYASRERFPTAWLRPEAATVDVTLLGYGGTSEILVSAAEKLFEANDLIAQVICPTQIYPFDVRPLLPIILNSKHLLIVEEGQGFAGFGSEVVAQIAETAPEFCSRLHRIAPPRDIIPSSGKLEKGMLPSLEDIIARAAALCP
jgi:2-oxoisovalerate dehydrogenase E1 component